MPRIAPTSCPMISGRSGLPKLRLSVTASGLAHRRFRGVRMRAVINRGFVAQLLDRQVSHDLAAVAHDEPFRWRGFADNGEVQSPFPEDGLGLLLLLRLEHHEHALLAFREH